ENMLRSGHRIDVDDETIIGRAILLGEPQIKTGTDPSIWAGERPIPSEVALPLQTSGQVRGAVHITHQWPNVFQREDVDVLALLADQVASSLENSRLLKQGQSNLAEIEALNRRLTQRAWEEYLGDQTALRHTLDPSDAWPETHENLGESGRITARTYTDADGRSVLAAPLILRGELIGALAAARPPDSYWTTDEIALMESVANRLVMIAESVRLVDESSRRAAREQRVNEISTELLQRAADVDGVLQTALNELSRTLGSDQLSLRIGPPPVEDEFQISDGQQGE
ncbi:MAG: GAF domain-containing protein, partial [Chloroflexi bacterium]|nr:GAF domain-containing protein [Chloroflexota bacterium]